MSHASLAMSAKAKAMYGKRISDNDYNALINKKSVAEIASYLKNETSYHNTLDGINENAIHRGQLEMLLRYDWFNRFFSLLRYADKQSHFYHYIVGINEIEQIMACLHMIENNDQLDLVKKLPVHLNDYMSFDLMALAKVKDYDQLLQIVNNTIYFDTLLKNKPKRMEDFNYVSVEAELTKIYYDHLIKTIDKEFKGSKKEKIKNMFLTQIELNNIIKIYRLKRYFDASSEQIESVISPYYANFSKKQIKKMIENDDAQQVLQQLRQSRYGSFISNNDFKYIEYHAKYINYRMNREAMHFSQDSDYVLLSYMILSETELENLVDIIEGVRYHIPSDQIASLLIK